MKLQLRESVLGKRNSLSLHEIGEKSSKIESNLLELEHYKKSEVVMFFVSFSNEVNTHGMIRKALKNKTVVIPKIVQHEIEPSVIIDFDSLIEGKFGIPEPIELMKIAYKSIDLVLVPGIVFGMSGQRIGYGFGFYDKFLKKVPKAVKIGLAFDFQIVNELPNHDHDVSVDFVVTEERVVECRK